MGYIEDGISREEASRQRVLSRVQSLIDKDGSGMDFIPNGEATIDHLILLAQASERDSNEYGISLLNHRHRNSSALALSKSPKGVFRVDLPELIYRYDHFGEVHFHTHPTQGPSKDITGLTVDLLPTSQPPGYISDFYACRTNAENIGRVSGLNIVSVKGLTLCTDVEPDTNLERGWTVLSGDRKGDVFTDRTAMRDSGYIMGGENESLQIMYVDEYSIARRFLFVPFDQIRKSQLTLHDIAFGNGLNKLHADLGLQTPHENLMSVAYKELRINRDERQEQAPIQPKRTLMGRLFRSRSLKS